MTFGTGLRFPIAAHELFDERAIERDPEHDRQPFAVKPGAVVDVVLAAGGFDDGIGEVGELAGGETADLPIE